ncbi:type I secretion C-terminal target domain-containing protein [Abyssogena phaseoliformis symbiont]|uniref:type I secretion C-terminal target domain-containing protein n=1 Tax=Abyssogena phaseoliformis symbiont TaxID=596095 RepID=UPI001915A0AB|nr:type I secretion C-terminal target domain-containing protein [Abyssogena phaseoliformis symbiont]
MSITNMDSTIKGWVKLDTSTGETAINNGIEWDIVNYSDATSKQYLIDAYNWIINNGTFDTTNVEQGVSSDVIDISDLLVGYGTSITDFVTLNDDGTDTTLSIDCNGAHSIVGDTGVTILL